MRWVTVAALAFAFLVVWPTDAQQVLVGTRKNRGVEPIVAEISSARIEATIRKLASFGTRHTLSDPDHPNRGIGAARRWIKAELESYAKECCGRLIVEEDSFVQPVAPRVPRQTTLVSRKLANRPRPAFDPTGLDQSPVTRAGQEMGSGGGYGT
jgi:hypothetical protein